MTSQCKRPERIRRKRQRTDNVPNRCPSRGRKKGLLLAAASRVVLQRRIGTAPLGKRLLRGARVRQHAEQSVVAFVAPAFVHHIRFVGVLPQFLYEGARFDPSLWI